MNPDVAAAIKAGTFGNKVAGVVSVAQKALLHFNTTGWKEGRSPNATFDDSYYLNNNIDVQLSNINPLDHYLKFGLSEGRSPNASIPNIDNFDSVRYLAANTDLAAAGFTAGMTRALYQHYILFGEYEGRIAYTKAGDTILPDGANCVTYSASSGYLSIDTKNNTPVYPEGALTFRGTFDAAVTFNLQSQTIATGSNIYTYSDTQVSNTYDFSTVSGKGAITIKGSTKDNIIIAPNNGGTIEPMAGNDTVLSSKTGTTTIVLGGLPAVDTKVATPYNNNTPPGSDKVGMFDANGVLTGAFKIGAKGDVLDLHNFLKVTDTKTLVSVDLLTAINRPAAVENGGIVLLQKQAADTLTIADLNTAVTIPVPAGTTYKSSNPLNLVVIVSDTNATHNTYVYGVQHYAETAAATAALQNFTSNDVITLMVTLVGLNDIFIPGHSFVSANFA